MKVHKIAKAHLMIYAIMGEQLICHFRKLSFKEQTIRITSLTLYVQH